MRTALFMSSAVAGYVFGVSTALLAGQTFFSVPSLNSSNDSRGTFFTSGGTILSLDLLNDTVTVDMVSPYSIYEHAPFRLTYSDKTSIQIGNGVLGNSYKVRTGKPNDLAVGMKVQVRISRQSGPLSIDYLRSL